MFIYCIPILLCRKLHQLNFDAIMQKKRIQGYEWLPVCRKCARIIIL